MAGHPVDKRFRILLEGLRTTLPGVTVLLAFLLTMPLQGSFRELGRWELAVYGVALFGAATTIVLLLAPTAHQYLRAPSDDLRRRHPEHVMTSVHLAIAGTVTLSVTVVAAVYLAADIAFGAGWAAAGAAAIAALAAWAWFWLPLVHFAEDDEVPIDPVGTEITVGDGPDGPGGDDLDATADRRPVNGGDPPAPPG